MLETILMAAMTAGLGADPSGYAGGQGYAPSYGQAGVYSGEVVHGGAAPVFPGASAVPFEQQLYPYDAQYPWLHGYFYRIPAYGGFGAFRPYNYKQVLSQSQAAGGWGMSPQMPYSQQFWHRYQAPASMTAPTVQTAPAARTGRLPPWQPRMQRQR